MQIVLEHVSDAAIEDAACHPDSAKGWKVQNWCAEQGWGVLQRLQCIEKQEGSRFCLLACCLFGCLYIKDTEHT